MSSNTLRMLPGLPTDIGLIRGLRIRAEVTDLTVPLLHVLGVDDAFDVIVCGDTLEREKPSPDRLWIGPSAAVMVSDAAVDWEAAAASVAFVHARCGYGTQLLPASLWIENLNGLTEVALGPAVFSLHA